jgi:hypothetical protein
VRSLSDFAGPPLVPGVGQLALSKHLSVDNRPAPGDDVERHVNLPRETSCSRWYGARLLSREV